MYTTICKWLYFARVSDPKRARLRGLYSEVSVVLIDAISMVSNIRLLHTYQRLCETFSWPESQPFADLLVLVVGHLLQLPPIKAPQIINLLIMRLVTCLICGHCL